MDVKEVITGNWIKNASHPALLLIHSQITPAMRKQLETCASMDRPDANFCPWSMDPMPTFGNSTVATPSRELRRSRKLGVR